ncbi:MAG: UDP-N-acetyl-D-mannosamine dehydrogenase [Alphaproteobacteria bacterium]|nr:UDP-N-acetyl-D-mannosamine dehydrogenase [Alphaproteobacteria bacterium]
MATVARRSASSGSSSVKLPFPSVAVIGLGYVGLPTAATLAARGVEVIGVDVNPRAVDAINQGHAHIVEPELDMMVRSAVKTGRLRAVTKPEPADAFIIAVPTPLKPDHTPDITYIQAAAQAIAPVLAKGNLVILESTSPVGTTESLRDWLKAKRPDLTFPTDKTAQADIAIAYCPERVLPGQMLRELVENDRIIGGISARCSERARALYRVFVQGDALITNARTAEMVKLCENAFRDVNIAFANELSIVGDKLGVDANEVIRLANHHPRVNILQPGPGVGGHCIAVDPWFLVHTAPDEARLIRTAREVNDSKPVHVIDRIDALADRFKKPVIACLGLAFKANIDDLRNSPAMEIVEHLARKKAGEILAVEPHVEALPKPIAGVSLVDADEAIQRADIVVLLVDHDAFREIDRDRLLDKAVVDTRGLWRWRRRIDTGNGARKSKRR